MFYRCQKFTTNQYKDKRKGSKQRSKVYGRQPWSGAPDCPVCDRTVSGASGRIKSNLPASGIWGGRSAIIHRTVRCSTGLSGVPAEQRLLRVNVHLQRTLNALQCAPARAEVRAGARRRTGQSTGPVRCTTRLSGGPIVRPPTVRTQRPGDVAGAPDSVRWRTGLSGALYDRSLHQWPYWWLGL
jgi:hypothetical protein